MSKKRRRHSPEQIIKKLRDSGPAGIGARLVMRGGLPCWACEHRRGGENPPPARRHLTAPETIGYDFPVLRKQEEETLSSGSLAKHRVFL